MLGYFGSRLGSMHVVAEMHQTQPSQIVQNFQTRAEVLDSWLDRNGRTTSQTRL